MLRGRSAFNYNTHAATPCQPVIASFNTHAATPCQPVIALTSTPTLPPPVLPPPDRYMILRRERSTLYAFIALPILAFSTVYINIFFVLFKGARNELGWEANK